MVRALQEGRTLRPPRWGLPDVAIALGGAFLISVAVVLVSLVVDLPLAWLLILGIGLPWIAMAGWPLLATHLRGNGPRIDLGLRLTWSDLGWGVLGGIAALVGSAVVGALVLLVDDGLSSAAGDAAEEIQAAGPPIALVVFAILGVIGAPIVEEIAFRGLAYNSLAKRGLHPAWVIALSALLFSVFHLEPIRIPILLVSGIVFAVLRWRTGALGAPIVAHVVVNSPLAAFPFLS